LIDKIKQRRAIFNKPNVPPPKNQIWLKQRESRD
jgi:hypothetical protein